jgi:hypothetical protein
MVGRRLFARVATADVDLGEASVPEHEDELIPEVHAHREPVLPGGDVLAVHPLVRAELEDDALVQWIQTDRAASELVLAPVRSGSTLARRRPRLGQQLATVTGPGRPELRIRVWDLVVEQERPARLEAAMESP